MKPEDENLQAALMQEICRVREVVLPTYEACRGMPRVEVGPAIFFIRASLDRAAHALVQGDVVLMRRAYEDLREYET